MLFIIHMVAMACARLRAVALTLSVLLIAHGLGCGLPLARSQATTIKAANPTELRQVLLSSKTEVAQFRSRGPFDLIERRGVKIPVDSDFTVQADLFLCAAASKGPLVIVLHGNNNSKEDHTFQAMHLASWGMHGLALDLPKSGPWIANGRTLAKLVDAMHQKPQLIDSRIDTDKIILAGHSFGGTAVAAALGEGAPALGAVLLDPTAIGRGVSQLLQRITVPVMVIGADEELWPARNRGQFFRFIPRSVGEISIRDTVHEDAQYPSRRAQRMFEDDPNETEQGQIAFMSALTASAFSLAATGDIDFAWKSFDSAFKNGMFFNPRRK